MGNGLMFRDPKAFVATFANADHDAINKVIEMVNGMIKQGEDEVEAATKTYHDARDVAAVKATELETAQKTLIFSKGELEYKSQQVVDAQTVVDLKDTLEAEALDLMNKNAVNLDVLTVYLESETARVNRERATLEEAVDALGVLLKDQAMYQSEVEKNTVIQNDAKDAKKTADAEAAGAKATMLSEEDRVASENEDLEEVKALLKDLL